MQEGNVLLDISYEKDLKVVKKQFDYDKTKPFGSQFTKITELFDIATERASSYCIQLESKTSGTYIYPKETVNITVFKNASVYELMLYANRLENGCLFKGATSLFGTIRN